MSAPASEERSGASVGSRPEEPVSRSAALSVEIAAIEDVAGGGVRAAAAANGAPAQVLDRVAIHGGVQVARLATVTSGDRRVAAALAVNRPLAAYAKVVEVWVEDTADRAAAVEALVEAFADETFAVGAVALKWQVPEDDDELAEILLGLGLSELRAPLNDGLPATGSLGEEEPRPPTVRGFVRWRIEPRFPEPPYWRQTTGFTCGPVSLLVGLELRGRPLSFSREEELRLWREATSGQGCDPTGLAAVAGAYAPGVTLVMTDLDPDLRDRSRPAEVREVRRFFQDRFKSTARERGVRLRQRDFTIEDVRELVCGGATVLLLIDVFSQRGRHIPHWVTVFAVHDGVFIVQDSSTEWRAGETWVDLHLHAVPIATLDQQAWVGDPGYRAMLVLDDQSQR